MKDKVIEQLVSIAGEDWVIQDLEKIKGYLYDETPKPASPKAVEEVVVVKPKNSGEISAVMELANEQGVPVIPRGAGTGLCGAAIPTEPSIILSLERLNDIIDLDEDNLMVTCEAGVPLESLFETVDETDHLFFPPHPGDEGAQVGGLVVENAGGARAVKYGVMRNYVKGMKVVLPTGEELELGGKILKNNTGYDLMHLLMGSEGTLGIITEVTLRLYPEAKETATLLVPFENRHDAMSAVPKVLKEGHVPLALEYVEKELIEESADHLGKSWPADEGEAFLILMITGKDDEEIFDKSETIVEVLTENGALEPLFAQRRKEQESILDIRSNIYTALEEETTDILDVTVPPAEVGNLMDRIDELADQYGTTIPVYGHAADGNVHPHIMNVDGEAPGYFEELKDEIYKTALDLGGVITGEHGIGETRIKNLPMALSEEERVLMGKIKEVFDPNGVLNPGKAIE
ncbi:MAG: FAD-binding oxidoreductase [Candidatus Bipolaricaulota bacterium]